MPNVDGSLPTDAFLPYSFNVDPSERLSSGTIDLRAAQQIEIPPGATEITIAGEAYVVDSLGDQADVLVQTGPTILGDFVWALGGNRRFEVEGIQVVPTE